VERNALRSRVIVSAGYDDATQTLELEFASRRIYRYGGVPRGVYDWLLRARSKGAYVSRMINGRYAHEDVTPRAETSEQELGDALRASLRERTRSEPE
jgi:hypothetical protein